MSVEDQLARFVHELRLEDVSPKARQVARDILRAVVVANALHRGTSRLEHFTPRNVAAPELVQLMQRITVVADPALDARGHSSVDLQVTTRDGIARTWGLDIAPGYPGEDLGPEQHFARFTDCMDYAAVKLAPAQQSGLLAAIDGLEQVQDVRELLPLLMAAR